MYVGEPMMIASAAFKVFHPSSDTLPSASIVTSSALAPSATDCAMRNV
jgi:hypothetical protein